MLWTPVNEFHFEVDNWGASYLQSALGTQITTGAANTKGSDTEILSDTVVTEDCYGISITFLSGASPGNVRNFLIDIKSDPTGGTSYSTIIPNLIANGPPNGSDALIGFHYFFPLFIKSGTALAAAGQCNAATINVRVLVRLFGKPSRPELCKVGSFVRAFGVDTATSGGTAVTPGTQALGSYSGLGTTADDLWWWQAGLAVNDTTQNNRLLYIDVAAGDASNKKLCASIRQANTNGEAGGKEAFGTRPPIRNIASGSEVFVRAACAENVPDSNITAAVYGLGG